MAGDLYFTVLLAIVFITGLRHPHVALSGAILVDLLTPQYLSSAWLATTPLALVAAVCLVISIALNVKKCSKPPILFPTILMVVFMLWMTYTTFQAQFQDAAWFKHDYVIKALFISLFIPFILNSRKKIDAGIAVIVGSVSYFAIVGGVRTVVDDVEYGTSLVVTPGGTSNISETSTLSMVCILIAPLVVHLFKNSTITTTHTKVFKAILGLIFVCCFITAIGTQARTGLVAIAIGTMLLLIRANMKVRVIGIVAILLISISPLVTDRWVERMNTLTEVETEGSALGRIIVWKWTLDYVSERPIGGGGFMSYQANAGGVLREYGPEDVFILYHDQGGKAFHSIYFEVLGEHGYVGLTIFLLILLSVWFICRNIMKTHKRDTWEGSLASALCDAILIYMVCGNFIGVAYTHWPYYILGLAVCLKTVTEAKGFKAATTSTTSHSTP